MSREEALNSYTWNNAYAAFEEKLKGSLEAGKLADITVLSHDIMTIPEDDILSTDVVYTIVGGAMRFERRQAWPADRISDSRSGLPRYPPPDIL